MADYRFLTTWCLEAPIEPVFAAIDDPSKWPQWWPGVTRVDLLDPGDQDGVGRSWRSTWRSRLPYDLTFDSRVTRREAPYLLEGDAKGELSGVGRWRLFEGQAATAVLYEWNVSTSRVWMNRLAPIGRPIFAWNHHAVMRNGGEGLARLLGAQLSARS